MAEDALAELSTTDQAILSTLNYHICRSDLVSVSTLADECSVCKSTVVKMAKKLGYAGFADMRDTLSAGRTDEVSESFLPLDTAEDGDALDDAERLAQLFWDRRSAKHVLMSDTSSIEEILSSYLARKLAMFDIFAVSTYDYEAIITKEAEPGIALFFEHNVNPKAGSGGFVLSVARPHFRLARQLGYLTMLVSDVPKETPAPQLADEVFRIKPSYDLRCDLFVPRTIMLFEPMLSGLSRLSQEEMPFQEKEVAEA